MEAVTVGVSLFAVGLVVAGLSHLSKGAGQGASAAATSPDSTDNDCKSDNTPSDAGQAQAREADTWASFDHTHHHSNDPGSPF